MSEEYTTAQSYVFIQQDGERSIIMASGATSLINKKAVEEFFGKLLPFKGRITKSIASGLAGGYSPPILARAMV